MRRAASKSLLHRKSLHRGKDTHDTVTTLIITKAIMLYFSGGVYGKDTMGNPFGCAASYTSPCSDRSFFHRRHHHLCCLRTGVVGLSIIGSGMALEDWRGVHTQIVLVLVKTCLPSVGMASFLGTRHSNWGCNGRFVRLMALAYEGLR